MWDRKELKARGKKAFKANYWRSVLVALLIVFVLGSSATAVKGGNDYALSNGSETAQIDPNAAHLDELFAQAPEGVKGAVVAAVVVAILIAAAVYILIDVLLLNPLELGCQRFFLANSEKPASLSELSYGFESNYRNVVRTIFLRDIYLFLWALLLLIPGLIKAYSYRMVPYILSENPNMKPKEVITLSRQMMNGQKWRSFVLDLSFIGWDLLSALSLFLVGIFYANPYQSATNAELYKAIRDAK